MVEKVNPQRRQLLPPPLGERVPVISRLLANKLVAEALRLVDGTGRLQKVVPRLRPLQLPSPRDSRLSVVEGRNLV